MGEEAKVSVATTGTPAPPPTPSYSHDSDSEPSSNDSDYKPPPFGRHHSQPDFAGTGINPPRFRLSTSMDADLPELTEAVRTKLFLVILLLLF
ncbi:uncharacterized protein DS421_14g472460 [Arachis hypogaea]|nr:uncharacterized protein DS421_14g472460 [Arachis hypogaea]